MLTRGDLPILTMVVTIVAQAQLSDGTRIEASARFFGVAGCSTDNKHTSNRL